MITAVVPISPIKEHPQTSILETTISSIRHHLPAAEIILTFDGVREEQAHRKQAYEEAIQRILWLSKSWGAVYPWVFETHQHQSGMLRAVLDDIRTPLLLYVEQDTPLVTDEPIDWPEVLQLLDNGDSNLVRFHHEAVIPEPHEHLMHGYQCEQFVDEFGSLPFLRTSQWSQRPHVASVAYYRRILECYFVPDAKAFIEDRMYGVVEQAYSLDGMHGWNQHRLHIYHPEGGNIKRSYHLDGRAGEPKYDDTQVW